MDLARLNVLRDDDCCLAVNKPGGLATQAPPQFDSLERRVRAWLEEDAPSSERSYLGLPHRLDRPVSGVILLAKTPRAARVLSRQFQRRQVQKTYWAFVEGQMEAETGQWVDQIHKLPDSALAEVVPAESGGGQYAELSYRVVRQTPLGTWLAIVPLTGRTHQIRVQASSRGHPVWGDGLYGSRQTFGPAVADDREKTIALHARSLQFRHPTTSEEVTLTADPPPAWRDLAADGLW